MGYIPAQNRVYLADKDVNVYAYALSLSVVEYQTAILREDLEMAAQLLPTLPKDQLNKVARFLEGRGMKELALEVTTDPDHKFELSLALDHLDSAISIAREIPEAEAEIKWKAIGDRALTVWRFDLAKEAFEKANDLSALLLLYLAIGERDGLTALAKKAGRSPRFAMTNLSLVLQRAKVQITWHLQPFSSLATPNHVWTYLLRRIERRKRLFLHAPTYRGKLSFYLSHNFHSEDTQRRSSNCRCLERRLDSQGAKKTRRLISSSY